MRWIFVMGALLLAGCGGDDSSGNTTAGGGGSTASGGSGGAGGSTGGTGGGAGTSATGGTGGGSGGTAGGGGSSGCGTADDMLPAWFRDFQPTKEIWVSPSGNDSNDGSSASSALRTTSAAFAKLAPGVRIDFMAGSYDCANAYVGGFMGTEAAPAVVVSSDGAKKALFDCAGGGGFLIDSSHYLGFDGIEIGNTSGHGFQVSSGSPGPWDPNTITNDIVLAHSYVHDTGLASFKASQARALYVVGNELAYADTGRQNVEMVAVDDAIIAGNEAHHSGQFDEVKGGGKHGRIYRNFVHDSAGGILVGGDCTGFQYLVDTTATYEASDLRVWDNVVVSSPSEAFRVVDCHDCTVSNNTFYAASPATFMRLITSGFANPGGNCGDVQLGSQNVHVENNVFAGNAPPTYAIASNDAPSALLLDHNAWSAATGDVSAVGSDVPFKAEASSLYVDPMLVSPPPDLHPAASSPLIGAGTSEPWITGNAEGTCWTNGVDIGAY
jgi:hypothetical protein